jgi:predicted MPP superfamily phosphohydrolase
MNEKSYCLKSFDFMFAGHAHGGQFILPFIGGNYSPGQGFLQKYYRGVHFSKINENTKYSSSRIIVRKFRK